MAMQTVADGPFKGQRVVGQFEQRPEISVADRDKQAWICCIRIAI